MKPEEFKNKMLQLAEKWYPENGHMEADDLLCEVLEELGYQEGISIFRKQDKWYS